MIPVNLLYLENSQKNNQKRQKNNKKTLIKLLKY